MLSVVEEGVCLFCEKYIDDEFKDDTMDSSSQYIATIKNINFDNYTAYIEFTRNPAYKSNPLHAIIKFNSTNRWIHLEYLQISLIG